MDETITKKQSFWTFKRSSIGILLVILIIILIGVGIRWHLKNELSSTNYVVGINADSNMYNQLRIKKLKYAESKLKEAKDEYHRWLALDSLALFLIDEGKIEDARAYAEELLKLAPKYSDSWNYSNAVHKAHISIGRIELRQNNVSSAKQHLLNACHTTGSSNLKNFGPNMLLAKELLEKGEREVVLNYLDLCDKLWEEGKSKTASWKEIIMKGGTPDFGANLLY